MTIGHTMLGGGAERVIVLHGWFGDHTIFSPVFDSLDVDGFRYAFIDFRGYGKSMHTSGRYTMEELAGDAIDLADVLGWKRFHLVGHSMGGMAIQRVIALARERVKSAVAITSVPASGSDMTEEKLALFRAAVVSAESRKAIVDMSTGRRLSSAWVRHIVDKSEQTSTREAFAGYLRSFTDGGFVNLIEGVETPILALVGEHDLAITRDLMKRTFLKWYPNATVETLSNSGHYPMQEIPVCLATVMQAFMLQYART